MACKPVPIVEHRFWNQYANEVRKKKSTNHTTTVFVLIFNIDMEKSQRKKNILSRIFLSSDLSPVVSNTQNGRIALNVPCVCGFAICVSCLLACRKLWLIFYSRNIKTETQIRIKTKATNRDNNDNSNNSSNKSEKIYQNIVWNGI